VLILVLPKNLNKMKKYFLFILFFANVYLNAQAPRKFYTRFGGYGHDIGYSVIQTLNGHYAVTGSTGSFGNGNSDVYLAFVDSMGWVRWEKSYGGFNNDIGKSIIQLADSGFVIAGYTNSFGSGGYDMLVVRTDKTGNLIWQKTFGGLDWDFANAVKTTPLGDSLIIAGNTFSFGYGKSDAYIVKTDLNGIFQWQKTYGGAEDDEFKSFVTTYNNQYAFSGTTKSMGDVKGDCWLFKTGFNGDSILSVKYGNNKKQFINDIVEDPNNKNFILCGANDFDGTDSTYAYILVMSENGVFNSDNQFSYKNMIDAQFTSVAHLKDINFVFARKQFNSSAGRKLEPMFMINTPLYDIPGGVTTYGSVDDEELYDVTRTRDKGFISVGYTKGFSSNLSDVFLVKVDSNYSSIAGATSLVGVNELKQNRKDFLVYPTLASTEVTVEYELDNTNTILTLSDCFGKVLYSEKIINNTSTISLSNFSTGVYFITLTEGYYSRTTKIIKAE
jgi:hypothetical protein